MDKFRINLSCQIVPSQLVSPYICNLTLAKTLHIWLTLKKSPISLCYVLAVESISSAISSFLIRWSIYIYITTLIIGTIFFTQVELINHWFRALLLLVIILIVQYVLY